MTIPAKLNLSDVAESVLIKGDLSMLSEANRATYYMRVCESIGLNPLTRPFRYLKLNGTLQLYATKDCTDQLRKIYGISVALVSQEIKDDVLIVHARASAREVEAGTVHIRDDEDIGTVYFPDTLKGVDRANAMMKCVTKAKRRVTLSICGLGMLDESEIDDTPGAERVPDKPAPNVLRSPSSSSFGAAGVSPVTVASAGASPVPPSIPPQVEGTGDLVAMAREAAQRGEDVFQVFWKNRTPEQQAALAPYGTELRTMMDKAE